MPPLERLWSRLRAGTRTDAVLVGLPLAFIGIFAVSNGVWVSNDRALILASIACAVLIADRLFVHPPTESE
ncbi:hypothetical protein Hrd1104_05785 [Halorhabdus sp. CBA1104]|uniref:hypothetical protein n=1 Tax=unclassified Halorhabdus TaxID=2621901 RepID=UPI0012B2ED1B|nr:MULTISPECIES: hypothetical protein [unclassified Halorhabdus]QGN06849.1 hypothetical protein Hrd1104_05785 [Halorhabdus sp. CBA1104]